MRSLTTSARTCSPNCLVITASGALPGRKPFRRAVRESCFRRCCTSFATSVAGTATSSRRIKTAGVRQRNFHQFNPSTPGTP